MGNDIASNKENMLNTNKIRTINLISATVKTKPPFYNLLKKNINITTCLNTVNDYKNRKNFCINLASEIMNTKFNNSLFNIYAKSYFFLSKKKDDLCDVIIQAQAFKYLHFV